MVQIRNVVLTNTETINNSGTKIIDLDLQDPITAIDVILNATNGSTSNQQVNIHDDIDKIEIVDGSDVHFDMNMILAQALHAYHYGRMPVLQITEAASGVQREGFRIPFGRFLGDLEYAYLPSRFRNPQLKVTSSLTISGTAGFATGTGGLTVIAKVLEGAGSAPRGFLMAKNVKNFTSVGSGDERTNMPIDYPYRMLLMRAYEHGVALTTDITKAKLTMDHDKFIPLELDTPDWLDMASNRWGFFHTGFDLFETDADTVKAYLGSVIAAQVDAVNDLDVASIDAIAADKLTLQLLTLAATPTIAKSSTNTQIKASVLGYAPHSALAMEFGNPQDPATWLQAQSHTHAECILTNGGADATVDLVLQQARAY